MDMVRRFEDFLFLFFVLAFLAPDVLLPDFVVPVFLFAEEGFLDCEAVDGLAEEDCEEEVFSPPPEEVEYFSAQ